MAIEGRKLLLAMGTNSTYVYDKENAKVALLARIDHKLISSKVKSQKPNLSSKIELLSCSSTHTKISLY